METAATMVDRIAKLFLNGGSQAVRLPAEFRFEGMQEVYIRRNAVTGEVILSPKPGTDAWSDFFKLRDQANVAADFMAQRKPVNEPLQDDVLQEKP
jgi:antitoxin VapB